MESRTIKQEDEIRNYKNYINDKISSLEAKISRMRREHQRYHEDEDDDELNKFCTIKFCTKNITIYKILQKVEVIIFYIFANIKK